MEDSRLLPQQPSSSSQSEEKAEDTASVAVRLLTQRFSCRYFVPDQAPSEDVLHAILEAARHAPSGSNFQPWKVHVIRGDSKKRLAQIVSYAHLNEANEHRAPYSFYPSDDKLASPDYEHLQRRREDFGKRFYGPLNIARHDKEARAAVTARNWSFFDAPVGLLITTLDDAPAGSYLDVGFLVMSLIVALRAHGLECCVQESHATFHGLYARELHLAPTESVVCGVAMGYPDWDKVHRYTGPQEKMAINELALFHD